MQGDNRQPGEEYTLSATDSAVPWAHSPRDGRGGPHLLVNHLQAAAARTGHSASKFGAGQLGQVAGLIHDLGKARPEFQRYLRRCCEAEQRGAPPPPKTAPHSVYGALQAVALRQELLAPVIDGHHGGLRDRSDVKARLSDTSPRSEGTDRLISKLAHGLGIPKAGIPGWVRDPVSCEFLIRMLFSCLVDSDWLDTEAHFQPDASAKRAPGQPLDLLWEAFREDQQRMLARCAGGVLNNTRREIYEACVLAADLPQGVFRLTVPTGGGKTRSGLGFALKHAIRHGLDRVIFAIPYTSIIDQTADVYREILGSDSVLEHHSSIGLPDSPTEDESEAEMRRRLASENWDAPVIVTTTVQLFDSLFANKPSRCRKLHNIARSVIVLDEVQTLPTGLLQPILSMLRQLVEHCGVTVVFCTATQPAFSLDTPCLRDFGLQPTEIVPDPERYFDALKRVDYEIAPEPWDWERVAGEMKSAEQALCVVNSRRDAVTLYNLLGDPAALHLSTLMCPAHRRETLNEIRRRLSEGEECRVVSTQVVEAGVDLDFPFVLRAMGPLDRIVQAAGRCNREGRLPVPGRVLVFRPAEECSPRGSYRTAMDEAQVMLTGESCDLHSPATFEEYFRRLWQCCNLDAKGIRPLRDRMQFAQVGERFHLIDEDTVPVAVRYGEDSPDRVLDRVRAKGHASRDDWRLLQPYTISLRRRDFDRHRASGLIYELIDHLYVWAGTYERSTGISTDAPDPADLIA